MVRYAALCITVDAHSHIFGFREFLGYFNRTICKLTSIFAEEGSTYFLAHYIYSENNDYLLSESSLNLIRYS